MNYCIDLFSGTGGFSAAFDKSRDWETFEVDLNPDGLDEIQPDLEVDVLDLSADDIPIPDDAGTVVVLASPPCKAFSMAAAHHHMDEDVQPKTDFAKTSLELVEKTLDLVGEIDPDFWFLENPRGGMRRVMREKSWGLGEPTGTVSWCQYGSNRQKMTDLWGRHPEHMVYRRCIRGESCHASAPRGSKTGTQGMNSSVRRAAIPYALSYAILDAVDRDCRTQLSRRMES